MKLADLLGDVPTVSTSGSMDVDVTSVTADSRLVRKGSVFVAIPGLQQDGAKFIGQALEKGAAAVVSGAPHRSAYPIPARLFPSSLPISTAVRPTSSRSSV